MVSDEVLRIIEEAARRNSEQLNLSDQGLTEIPRQIFKLQNLRRLYLHNNQKTIL